MKVLSFSSDVKTRHVFGWVSILWFTSAVSVAVSQGVKLQTSSQMVAQCGKNVTLTCDASSSGRLKIILFNWLAKNKSLCNGDVQPDSEVLCERTESSVHRLTLTLLNVMPVNQGEYICKLHGNSGAKHSTTKVTVQDCVESYHYSIDKSHAECSFSGVYPIGTVNWFQGDVNLTHSARTQVKMDHHGRYNVSSTIDIKKGNLNQPYECTLWIPSARKSLASQTVQVTGKLISLSGGKLKLQWICVMVGIMTFMI